MPYYYFDSTALVKRYSMERGTRIVNKLLVKRGKVAVVPTWSVTDFYAMMSTRAQEGHITRDDCYSVFYKFETESKQGLFSFIVPTLDTYLRTKELVLEYLQEAMNELKEAQQECIELFYMRDCSYLEISKITGYTLNEVKSHIQNGKRNLKKYIAEKDEQAQKGKEIS